MQVDILHASTLIGRGVLDASDPPMGVASGSFEPSDGYERQRHAGEIEGVYNPVAANLPFTVRSGDGSTVDCLAVFIQDYAEGLGERHISVLGIPADEYQQRFGRYVAYRAYRGDR